MKFQTAYGQWEITENDAGHLQVTVVGAGAISVHPVDGVNTVELRLPPNRKKQRPTLYDKVVQARHEVRKGKS
jgi:hypothetical protein